MLAFEDEMSYLEASIHYGDAETRRRDDTKEQRKMTSLPSVSDPRVSHPLADLPIGELREGFMGTHGRGHTVIVAPTGSGKSTLIPLWCAERGESVLVVEPRRVACRSLARFLSTISGTTLGGWIGYVVRYEDRTREDTQITFATPGVALRIVGEGGLDRYDTVLVDEFHERSLQTDLFLALCKKQEKGPLVVMSATLEGERVAQYVDGVLLTSEGRQHPVEVEYTEDVTVPNSRDLGDRVLRALDRAFRHPGDVLVFLPGKGEISECLGLLGRRRDLDVIALHGDLPPAEQDRAFAPGEKRRVILSTNVAETSVTLPRIGVVVDSGLARRNRYRNGRTVLELSVISGASAEQRRGRAGRLSPGHCVRMWSRKAALESTTPPEILRENLSTVVLTVAACGHRIEDLEFLDAPKPYAVEDAVQELRRMGALEANGTLTSVGRGMFRLPVDPQYARLLMELSEPEYGEAIQDAVDLIGLLSQDRPLFLPGGDESTHRAREELNETGCDVTARVTALRGRDIEQYHLHPAVYAEARRAGRQLREVLHLPSPRSDRVRRESLMRAFLKLFPDMAYVRRARGKAWANGAREVVLAQESRVKKRVQAIVVVDTRSLATKGTRTVTLATCAMPCTYNFLIDMGIGTRHLEHVRREGSSLIGSVQTIYAGRVLREEQEELEGELALEAFVQLALRNKIFPEEMGRLREEIDAWNLYVQLHPEYGGSPVQIDEWLTRRFRELGVSGVEDLELLVPEDVRFEGIPPAERERFDRDFPRRLYLGGMTCDVRYDRGKKTVTLIKNSGLQTVLPNPQYLPKWNGWRVVFQDRQRLFPVRG